MQPEPFTDSRRVEVDPAHAAGVVRAFCEETGREFKAEYSRAEVVALLRAVGFEVCERTLSQFIEREYVPDPLDQWSPVQVYLMAAALDSRRRWQPFPNRFHDQRKSGFRLMVEQMEAAGVKEPIEDLNSTSLEDLLIQLVVSDNRMVRESLFECVRRKLAGYEE